MKSGRTEDRRGTGTAAVKKHAFTPVPERERLDARETEARRFLEQQLFFCMLLEHCRDRQHAGRRNISAALSFHPRLADWVVSGFHPVMLTPALCPDCLAILSMVDAHTARCRHMAYKTFCHGCPTPCYRAEDRVRVTPVMKSAGLKLLLRHPVLSLRFFMMTVRWLRFHRRFSDS